MPTWVAVDSSSYFFTSWVADCGPYTGPDSPQPPVWTPADADEVDYYVGVPNPDGQVENFADGSYDAGNVYDVWRYRSGSDELTNKFGSGPITPGSHLFVAWFTPGFPSDPTGMPAPSKPPLALVAPGYVAGAYGPYRSGHYSDWIDGATADGPPTANYFRTGITVSGETIIGDGFTVTPTLPASNNAIYTDARTDLQGLLDAALATTTGTHGGGGGADFDVHKQGMTGSPGFGFVNQYYASFVDVGQEYLTIHPDPPALDYDHAVLDALTEGVDYGPDPDGQLVTYEDSEPSFLNWLDWSFTVSSFYTARTDNLTPDPEVAQSAVPENVEAMTVYYQALTTAVLTANDTDAPFQPFGAGTNLATVDTTIPTPTTPSGGSGEEIRGGDDYTATLPLSTLGDEPVLTLFSQSNIQDDTTEPLDDFTVHNFAGGVDTGDPVSAEKFIGYSFVSHWERDLAFALITPQGLFQQPRWRYWVPGELVFPTPLRTVGGYWASVGGAVINMKQPDGTWVPITDIF